MNCHTLHLKDTFPFLGEDDRDPTLQVLLAPTVGGCGKTVENHPCLLICPGGGYGILSDREAIPVGLPFSARGYHVFILHYSVAPHRFPSQQQEVAAAIALICQNAAQWKADPDRIAIMGFSAGGHVAASYSCDYDCPEIRQVFPQSRGVQAAILSYPVITADPAYRHTNSFIRLLGHEPGPEEIARFSCENRVTERTPPTFLWHTAADKTVPVANTYRYAAALAAHGVPAEVHVFPEGPHGLATADGVTNGPLDPVTARAGSWLGLAADWLSQVLSF